VTIQKVEIEVAVPEGWEVVGQRSPRIGDYFLSECSGPLVLANMDFVTNRIVLRKVKQYREPVLPADYGKQAEFSSNRIDWEANELTGWLRYHQEDLCSWSNQGDEWYPYCRIEVEAAS
jgi:hypothetical protein